MAKINLESIQGYAEMSLEEKIKALEEFEYDDGSKQIANLKKTVSETSSQAAEWKRKHNDLLSAEERQKIEQEEELTSLRNKLASLEQANAIKDYSSKYMSMGYPKELADSTAKAMVDNDLKTVLENQETFNGLREKELKAKLMGSNPRPDEQGNGDKVEGISKEQFEKMSYAERCNLFNTDPDTYNKLKE